MRKIRYLLAFMCMLLLPSFVNAASGTISVSGTSTAVVGNKVTVTVTLSSGTSIGSWQMNLSYDKSYLQLTSSTAEAGGTVMAASSTTGVKSKKYTFTFKTLKKGSTSVSVGSYDAYAFDDLSQMSLSSGSKTIKIITQEELEASYSKDNNLKSLSVEGFELSPTFTKDVLEYNVVVPEDTKQITISAAKNDSTATINGDGTFDVTQGINTFEIVVRAQNGAEKTYKITVEVKDNNPINVTVDNVLYTVVKLKENLPVPVAYQETTIKINEFDIPAFHSEITGITLVGLKDVKGNIKLFIYDEEKEEYKSYTELSGNKIIIFPLETDKVIEGYKKSTIKINDVEVPAFKYNNNDNFAVIYGINIENGEEGFFIYDKSNNSFIKYSDDQVQDLNEQIKLYTNIIIGFSALLVLMFIVIICLIRKRKKRAKNISKTSVETKDKKNKIAEDDIKEVVSYEEKLEKSKKKKKK